VRFRDLARTSLSNLGRHKARTALTTTGVIVGILTIVTMVSLGIGVQREMLQSFDSIGLETLTLYPVTEDSTVFDPFGQPQRTKILDAGLLSTIQSRDDVLEVIPYLQLPRGMRIVMQMGDEEVSGNPREPSPSTVSGPFEIASKVLAGQGSPPAGGGGIVIGLGAAQKLGFEADELSELVGRELVLELHAPRGDSQTYDLAVTGVTDRQMGNFEVALPDRLAMLEWWYNDPEYLDHRGYDQVIVRARSLNDATHIVDWMDEQGFGVRSLKTILDMANRGMIILQTMLASVGTLALLVASIGIANTMIMSVYERTKEIGILKAVGASAGQVRSLFVIEASLIGLLGGIVGTLLGWLLGIGLNVLILEILEWQDVNVQGTFFVVSWWLVAIALAFATLVGLVAGLYPAARAARLPPLEALRYD
jgi:ABC-type lipoprotein release transport system permease subunit